MFRPDYAGTESGTSDTSGARGWQIVNPWWIEIVSGYCGSCVALVDSTRGGKGMIARVLSRMIGTRNVCGPTLNSQGGDSGLAPIIVKSVRKL